MRKHIISSQPMHVHRYAIRYCFCCNKKNYIIKIKENEDSFKVKIGPEAGSHSYFFLIGRWLVGGGDGAKSLL